MGHAYQIFVVDIFSSSFYICVKNGSFSFKCLLVNFVILVYRN